MAILDRLTILPVIGHVIAFFRQRIAGAFIVHPGILNEVKKWWSFVGEVESDSKKEKIWEWILCHIWPVSGQKIFIQNGRRKTIRVIYIPLTAKLIRKHPDKAEKMSIMASKLAERLGAAYIGLGGQVPGNCEYGLALKPRIKKAGLTTGHAYSLGMVYAHLLLFVNEIGIDFERATVAVVGAGSMGRGIAMLLSNAHKVGRLILIDLNKKILQDLAEEIYQVNKVNSEISTDLYALQEADIIISLASIAKPIIFTKHLKPKEKLKWSKLLMIEDGYPACISPDIINKHENAVIVAGGGTKMSVLRDADIGFGLLPKEYTVSCFAELVVLMLMGWKSDYTVGKVDISLIDKIYSNGIEMSFYPGCLSSDRKLTRACRKKVDPRKMLFRLIEQQNNHKSNNNLAFLRECKAELAKA